MTEESITHKTIRTSIWGAVQKFSTMGISFLITVVLTRLLTPDDFGTIALLNVFFAVADSIAECGFANALVRKSKCTQSDYSTAFFYNFGVSLLMYVVLFFTAPLISKFYDVPLLTNVLRVSGLTLIIRSFNLTQSVQLTRRLEFKKFAIISVFSNALSGLVGIFFAYHGLGVWALVIQSMVQSCVTTLTLIYFVKWMPTLTFSESSFKYLWNFGSKMLATGLISTLYTNIYSVVIGKVYNPRDLGLFNRGQSAANLFPSMVGSVILKGTFPILCQIKDDRERMLSVYGKYVKLVSFLNMPVCMILCALAEPFVLFVFTEKWISVVPFIRIFCCAALLEPVGQVNLMIFQVEGRSDITLKLEIIKKIVGFSMVFILTSFGPIVLAVGAASYVVFAYCINLFFVNRLENISYTAQMKDISPFMISSIIAAILCFSINYSDLTPFLKLLVGSVAGLVIYLLLMKCVFRSDILNRVLRQLKFNIKTKYTASN